MTQREARIREYFDAWVRKDARPLAGIFAPDILYSECYGPEYRGIGQVLRWFADWNTQGTVLQWPIKQFVHQGAVTAVEWYFQCEYQGQVDGFDGVSLITFDDAGRMVRLQEFQSKAEHHLPYGPQEGGIAP